MSTDGGEQHGAGRARGIRRRVRVVAALALVGGGLGGVAWSLRDSESAPAYALLVALPLLVGITAGVLVGWRARHPLAVGAVGVVVLVGASVVGTMLVVDRCHPGPDSMCAFAGFLVVIPAGSLLVGVVPALLTTVLVRRIRRRRRARQPGR